MGKSINERMKNAPDAIWERLVAKHKALGTAPFVPPLTPILKAYHGNFQKYVDLLAEKAKLKTMLDDFMAKTNELGGKQTRLLEEAEKIDTEDGKAIAAAAPKIKGFTGDPKADLALPNEGLAGYALVYADFVSGRKALWEQIIKIGEQKMAMNKKVRDDFKAKSDVITKGVEKLESDADKQESQARQILTNYQKIAIKMEHDDWVDEIRAVADAF